MAPSIWQIAIVILIILIFFGRGKISNVMEDLAKGIKSFKKGMKDEEPQNSRISDSRKQSHNDDVIEASSENVEDNKKDER